MVETLRKKKSEGEKTIRLFCYYLVIRDEFAMTQVRVGLYGTEWGSKEISGSVWGGNWQVFWEMQFLQVDGWYSNGVWQ